MVPYQPKLGVYRDAVQSELCIPVMHNLMTQHERSSCQDDDAEGWTQLQVTMLLMTGIWRNAAQSEIMTVHQQLYSDESAVARSGNAAVKI